MFGNPSDGVRDIPDVSLFAANGVWDHYYVFCWSDPSQNDNGSAPCTGAPDNWSGAGGTSFASPIMAGIQALVNQKAGGPQGNPNPVYYSLAADRVRRRRQQSCNSTLGNAVASSCIFYDVTLGDMDVNCTGTHNCYLPSGTYGVLSTSDSSYQPAYGTTTGWDFATGIGTVNAANLVNNWPGALSATTTTLVSSAPGGAIQGATVTFTATVTTLGTNPPTGTVNFNDGNNQIGSGTLSTVGTAQVATFSTTTLAIGTHSITAIYAGDTNNAGSTSTPVSQVITAVTTTTTLTSSNLSPAYGAAVTLTATVATTGTHKPTGTVTFNNGNTVIGMSALNGSQVATLATSAFAVGANSITATYGGDANNSSSTSTILTETVAGPTITLTNTGVTSTTVLAGVSGTGYAFTLAPAAPAPNFGAPVALACSFAPTDPTLTSNSCVFSINNVVVTSVPASASSAAVTLQITTAGPNGAGAERRRRAANSSDNHSPWLPLTLPLAGIVMVGFAGRKVWKHSATAGLCVALLLIGVLVACGGSSSPPILVAVSTGAPASVYPNYTGWPLQTAAFSATVTNTNNQGVTWAVTTANGGTIASGGLDTATYTAPTVAAGLPTSITIVATSVADTTKTGSAPETLTPATIPTQLQPGQTPYTVTVTATDPVAVPTTQTQAYTLTVQ